MEFFVFFTVGLLAGWIANRLVEEKKSALFPDLVIGVAGAVIGGSVFKIFDMTLYGFWGSLGISVLGSTLLLLLIGMFYKRRFQARPKT